jgi:hypothetical protein
MFEKFLLMSAINNNTISVWFSPLESINFDESIDIIPSSESSRQNSEPMQIDFQNNKPVVQQQKPNVIKSYQTSEELQMQQQRMIKENPFADRQQVNKQVMQQQQFPQ